MLRFFDSDLFTVLYPLLLTGMVILGYMTARNFYLKKNITWKSSGVENGIIGLFSLLLSFTFAMSGNAQKERTGMVHRLADGISELKNVADIVLPRERGTVHAYLRQHIDLHLDHYDRETAGSSQLVKEITALNETFWSGLRKKNDSATFKGEADLVLDAFNQLNAASLRVAYSYDERIPAIMYVLLTVSSLLLGILVGFMNGFYERRHVLVPLIYLVIVSLMMQGIRDIDTPYKGPVRPKYESLRNLRASL